MELTSKFAVVVWTAALVAAGCSRSPSPGEEPAQEAPTQAGAAASEAQPAAAPGPVPNECGIYEVDVELPERHGCEKDDDCQWTGHGPGNCNEPLCPGHYRAGVRAWVEAVEALHERVCTGQKYGSCIRVKCIHKKPERAVCKAGKCDIVFAGQ